MARLALFCPAIVFVIAATTSSLYAGDETATIESRLLGTVSYLASEECEGRGPGTKGIDLAADYIAEQFRKAGLRTDVVDGEPFQPFPLKNRPDVAPATRLTFVAPANGDDEEPTLINLKLTTDFSPITTTGTEDFDLPLVFVGYGITGTDEGYDDYHGVDVKGKAVVILRHEPRQDDPASVFNGLKASEHASFRSKLANAAEHGAACAIFCTDEFDIRKEVKGARKKWQDALDRLAAEHEKFKALDDLSLSQMDEQRKGIERLAEQVGVLSKQLAAQFDPVLPFGAASLRNAAPKFAVVHCRRSVMDRVIRAATGNDLATIERQIDSDAKPRSRELKGWRAAGRVEIKDDALQVKNVLGVLEGEGPHADETIVIGAHYDHLGVRKTGSGEMEVYNGADDNASGVAAMIEIARTLTSREKKLGRRVVFVAFTAEERGLLGSRHYVENPPIPLEKTVAMLNLDMVGRLREDNLTVQGTGTGTGFEEMLTRLDEQNTLNFSKRSSGIGPSDHATFCGKNIPVLFFITGMHGDLHKPTDDVEKLNIIGMRRVCQLVSGIAGELANLETPPKFQEVATNQRGKRAYLGITPAENQTDAGLAIGGVISGGPAGKAGLAAGDVIVKFGETPIRRLNDLLTSLQKRKGGDKVPIALRRGDKDLTVEVTLEMP